MRNQPEFVLKKNLLVCYNFHPSGGSEEAVGFQFARISAAYRQTVVYTQQDYRKKIAGEVVSALSPDIEVRFFQPSWLPEKLKSVLPVSWYYQLWHLGLFLELRSQDLENSFALCQVSTWVSAVQPVFSMFLPLRTIWGPLGGVARPELSFFRSHPLGSRLYERARHLVISLAPLNPILRNCYLASDFVLSAAEDARNWIVENELKEEDGVQVVPAITFPEQLVAHETVFEKSDEEEKVQMVTATRLLPWKGIDILLEAVASSDRQDLILRVFGDGPDRARLENLVHQYDIAKLVQFEGKVDREDFLQQLRQADLFLFASLHDSEGGACMEASGLGVPCVLLDFGGVASCLAGCAQVTAIEAKTRREAVERFSKQIRSASRNSSTGQSNIPSDSLLFYENKKRLMHSLYRRLDDE